ncbi:MAG: hypothetical protein HFI30_11570 [Lachnospiraceae bacterium]|nr:hypothetical protein [Oscillospiraceae bacterium]MCI8996298.1 hypothetical protein [Lachnospiraceae bacterium]
MYKRRDRWSAVILLSILMVITCLYSAKESAAYGEQEIYFSVEDSFCAKDQWLELSTMLDSDIYYTMDGSVPTEESCLYEGPILMKAYEEVEAATIRAIAYYQDGSATDVYTRTYFLGKQVEERFSTIVVAISTDPENLYGYENGILVPGKLRDDYIAENPDAEITPRTPANYNWRGMEGEREAYVEMWEPEGTCVVSQNMGIRVSGGTSRAADMKSLRLIARKEYGKSRIFYGLFPGARSDAGNTALEEYKKVVLRNHGNDQGWGYLRNELAQQLAADAGFRDAQAFRPAAVFINGEYYGFEWLEENYDDVYFHTHYGTRQEQGRWQVFTPHRGNANTASEDEADIRAVLELNEVFSYKDQDLQDDEVFARLQDMLDIENFLQYSAIELYLSNPDWPNNNCKAYRWYSRTGDYSNPCADGKWRFLLYDVDVGMARTDSSKAANPTLGEALGYLESGWDRDTPLLRAVLQREDMRERFTEIMEELMEGAFSPEHAGEVIEEMEREIEDELAFYGGDSTRWQEELEKIRDFFEQRPKNMRQELQMLSEYFLQEEG